MVAEVFRWVSVLGILAGPSLTGSRAQRKQSSRQASFQVSSHSAGVVTPYLHRVPVVSVVGSLSLSERGQKSPLSVRVPAEVREPGCRRRSTGVGGQAGIEKEVKKRSGGLRPRPQGICAGR